MKVLLFLVLFPVLAIAQGYAPRGSSGASPCGVTMSCAAISYTSTITDGTAGFIATGYGQILSGPGFCTGIAVDPNTGYTHAGCLGSNSVWMWGTGTLIQSGQVLVTNGVVGLVGNSGFLYSAATLDICNSWTEGLTMWDATSGKATGHATRICVCRSDGSSGYKWWNVFSVLSTGTATTCPD